MPTPLEKVEAEIQDVEKRILEVEAMASVDGVSAEFLTNYWNIIASLRAEKTELRAKKNKLRDQELQLSRSAGAVVLTLFRSQYLLFCRSLSQRCSCCITVSSR